MRMTRLGKMSTDGKANEVIVELCRISGKRNTQLNQDHHIEGDETQAIDSQITFKIFGELFVCMWLVPSWTVQCITFVPLQQSPTDGRLLLKSH